MKKILFFLAFVLGCVSVQAQEIIRVYKNGSLVKIYGNDSVNSYKIVVGNGGDGKTHEMVDLGLSVKWASCNIGADTPYKRGSFFAWGEGAAKSWYAWDSYKYGKYNWAITKYCSSDGKTVLVPEDDAASVNWGLSYRMPTKAEFQELLDSCKWTWDSTNKGYSVTAPNGNSIFLPATGEYYNNIHFDPDTKGGYWSCTRAGDPQYSAYQLYFNRRYSECNVSTSYRCDGYPVRPVAEY